MRNLLANRCMSSLLFIACATPVAAQTDAPKGRVLEIDTENPAQIYQVTTSFNVGTNIEFPESWAAPPTCASCVFASSPEGTQGLFRVDLVPQANTMVVKPAAIAGAGGVRPDVYVTSLTIKLKSGVPLTLFLRLGQHETADARVVFRFPSETKSERKAYERKLDQDFEQRVSQAVRKNMMERLSLASVRCKNFLGSPRRDRGLVVRLRQMCVIGKELFVSWEAENRSPSPTTIGSVVLSSDDGETDTTFVFSEPILEPKERRRGAVSLKLETERPGVYGFELLEDGGDERVVRITGLRL